MPIKKIIAVRHGIYCGQDLTPEGIEQIKNLSEKIKSFVNGHNFVVFTSPAPRAIQTAQIICDNVGVSLNPIVCNDLYDDDYSDGKDQIDSIMNLIGEKSFEVMIAVTHYKAPLGIVDAFAEKFLSKKRLIGDMVINEGSGIVLDIEKSEYEFIYCRRRASEIKV